CRVSSVTSGLAWKRSPRSSPTWPSSGCASRSTLVDASCRWTSAASPGLAGRWRRRCRSSPSRTTSSTA
ncbi:MAG: hypothetical protein AVDCRST_MAG50-2841, partial [uncultured Acidimicrobiales bacterium]